MKTKSVVDRHRLTQGRRPIAFVMAAAMATGVALPPVGAYARSVAALHDEASVEVSKPVTDPADKEPGDNDGHKNPGAELAGETCHLDVNFMLDGEFAPDQCGLRWLFDPLGSPQTYGTFDLTVTAPTGEKVVERTGIDDYVDEVPAGSTWAITNVRAADGKSFDAEGSSALTGTLTSDWQELVLKFDTAVDPEAKHTVSLVATGGVDHFVVDGETVTSLELSTGARAKIVPVLKAGYRDASWMFGNWANGGATLSLERALPDGTGEDAVTLTMGNSDVTLIAFAHEPICHFDVNFLVDGVVQGNQAGGVRGTFDLTITSPEDDVVIYEGKGIDDFVGGVPVGSVWSITNVTPAEGYCFEGALADNLTGTVGEADEQLEVVLRFVGGVMPEPGDEGVATPEPGDEGRDDGGDEGIVTTKPGDEGNDAGDDAAETYTLRVELGEGVSGITINGKAAESVSKLHAGDKVVLSATLDDGYAFDRWEVVSGQDTCSLFAPYLCDARGILVPAEVTMGSGDVVVRASATRTYSLSVAAGEGVASAGAARNLIFGWSDPADSHTRLFADDRLELVATPAEGRELGDWQIVSGAESGARIEKDEYGTWLVMGAGDVALTVSAKPVDEQPVEGADPTPEDASDPVADDASARKDAESVAHESAAKETNAATVALATTDPAGDQLVRRIAQRHTLKLKAGTGITSVRVNGKPVRSVTLAEGESVLVSMATRKGYTVADVAAMLGAGSNYELHGLGKGAGHFVFTMGEGDVTLMPLVTKGATV